MTLWRRFVHYLKRISNFDERGTALVITLFIMVVLVLLGLALLLLSETEYSIAVNEQDATICFGYADGGMQWISRRLRDISKPSLNPTFTNFTVVLRGAECSPFTNMSCPDATTDDNHLLGFDLDSDGTHDLNTSLDLTDLNSVNEETQSVATTNFLDGTTIDLDNNPATTEKMEAFLWGIDTDGDGNRDGARALIYVRVDDNFDEGAATNNPIADTDNRIHATIIGEYPIIVSSNGINEWRRGTSRRTISARFGPQGGAAIMTEGSLSFSGQFNVCGDCGSVHANTDLTIAGDIDICQDATASGNYSTSGGSYLVGGLSGGGFDEVFIPVINPFDDIFVPNPNVFETAGDASLPWNGCNPDPTTNPGAYKYFALIANSSAGKVYKAYYNENGTPSNTNDDYWQWKMIDDLSNSNNVKLDDCGRVVDCAGEPVCVVDGAGIPVNDGQTSRFYGYYLNPVTTTGTCSGSDATLSILANNDFTDAARCTGCAADGIVLPGSDSTDGVADFNTNFRYSVGETQTTNPVSGRWIKEGNTVYSPTYGAVVFYHGNVRLAGNLNNLVYSGGSVTPPGTFWRATHVAVGNIQVEGTPQYSTAHQSWPFLLIAGRDIDRAGNAAAGVITCPDECASDPSIPNPSYYGIIAAHEQILFRGSSVLDGFAVAENAINCATLVDSAAGVSTGTGGADVHYDCEHPPNPWAAGVTLLRWEEIP
jgi:Tfp pilus assembly protein PilX